MAYTIEEIEKEVLQIHIGSAGIEIGNYCWQLYCLEHDLNSNGYLQNEINTKESRSKSFFSQENSKYRPHTLFIDCDSSSIDEIKTNPMKDLYNNSQFLISINDTYSIMDGIRKQIEKYDFFQGFIISHSTSGRCSNSISEMLINLKSNKICRCDHTNGKSSNHKSLSTTPKY